jgi:DNA-binding NarL/FixJ family response regulator
MGAISPETLRPTALEAIKICIIDADPCLSNQLSLLLAQRLRDSVRVIGTFESIPAFEDLDAFDPDVVIFDPELSDFRRLNESVRQLRTIFGLKALLIAHSDTWKESLNPLRLELITAGVSLGIKRYDFKGAIEIASYVAQRLPKQALLERFGH